MNTERWCCDKQIKNLYNNIKEFDYYESIIQFSKNNIFFKKYITARTLKKLKSNKNNDVIINYYIKSQNNLSIIILYPKALKQSNKVKLFYDNLYNNGYIHYEKDIKINYIMMYNLLYLLYADENKMNSHNKIMNKLNYIGFTYNNFNIIKIIVYKHYNQNIKINGSSSPYKTILRTIFLEENQEIYDYLHISSNDNQVYEYSNIFFNKNTLNALKKQKCWRLFEMNKSIKKFNILKNFLYNNNLNEIENTLIINSSVLFSYGIREIKNISGIILKGNIKVNEINKLNNKYHYNIIYDDNKILDNKMNIEWINKFKNYADILGVSDYRELVMNPKYYYYFMGCKLLRLKYEILLKLNKYLPQDIADLLILKQMYNLKYKLYIPINYVDNKLVSEIYYLINIQNYLYKRYYLDITTDQIKIWLTQFSK